MNIILVYPPQQQYEGYGQDKRWLPLGIASLASYIKQQFPNVNVTCLDLFRYSKEDAMKKIVSKLKHCDINIVGYTVFTEQRFSTWELAEGLKLYYLNTMKYKERYKVVNIVGGPHVSLLSEQVRDNYKYIDHIVKGEGEKAICEIIEAYQNNTHRSLKKIIDGVHVDINKLPDSIEGLQYFDELIDLNQEVALVTSRGCTDYCSFSFRISSGLSTCSTKVWKGFRSRKAFSIYSEMLKYENYFGIKRFKFHDDACTGDLEEWKNLCRLIIKYKKKWSFEITARIDHFDEELIKLLKEAGCHTIAVGIESGNAELRKKMNKKLDIEKAITNCNLIKYYGIKLVCMFIVGYQGETDETIKDSQNLIRQLKPDIIYRQPLMIFPGTRIYNDMVKNGNISDDYWLKNQPQPYCTLEHSFEKLQTWCQELDKALRPLNILIAAPVSEDKEVFKKYIDSLNKLNIPSHVNIQKLFILDNCKELEDICKDDNTHILYNEDDISYDKTEKTHEWKIQNLQKVAGFKNHIVKLALENNFDYIFWVDSDLILQPETLEHLLSQNKNIIAEIFWTAWTPDQSPTPNAWMTDHFTFTKENQWEDWKQKGVYEVGGTGACILVDTKVYKAGANYTYIPNVSFSMWEDRAFCIKAVIAGYKIYLDSNYPAEHLYR